jgi:acyl carrier protein
MSVAAEVEKFIVEEIALGTGVDSVGHDDDLLAQDVIDSLGIVELVAFLETRYGIKVGDDDLLPENFQSVNSVVAFVAAKGGS